MPDNETFADFKDRLDDYYLRFVEIDCGHIFESTEIDSYFQMKEDPKAYRYNGQTEISYVLCPKCKEPVLNCKRYSYHIKKV